MLRKSLHFRWCSRTCPRTPRNTLPPALALHAIVYPGQRLAGERYSLLALLSLYELLRKCTETGVAFTREYT